MAPSRAMAQIQQQQPLQLESLYNPPRASSTRSASPNYPSSINSRNNYTRSGHNAFYSSRNLLLSKCCHSIMSMGQPRGCQHKQRDAKSIIRTFSYQHRTASKWPSLAQTSTYRVLDSSPSSSPRPRAARHLPYQALAVSLCHWRA